MLKLKGHGGRVEAYIFNNILCLKQLIISLNKLKYLLIQDLRIATTYMSNL